MQTGLQRNNLDKFYTKESVATKCIDYVKNHLSINPNDLIIEPSAGDGIFIPLTSSLSNHHLFLDLEPQHPQIIKQDYLTFSLDHSKKYDKIHIIGNPPFGRQSSLAIKFIKKSCEFCDSISFILPKSFKKSSLKNKFSLNFHLLFEKDLPNNSFLIENTEYNVPCVFQIWVKQNIWREKPQKLKPINFVFVKKTENPDISFRRVGFNAGTIDVNIENKNIQTHYFIKFNNDKSLEQNIKLLTEIKFESNNTVGPKSISKQELISKLNLL